MTPRQAHGKEHCFLQESLHRLERVRIGEKFWKGKNGQSRFK